MTIAEFRKIALSMPEAEEGEHMGHPDFRVKGKIFASLFPRDGRTWGMLKLRPNQQKKFVTDDPGAFMPVSGAWGRSGATQVCLKSAAKAPVRSAMFTAWLNTAPKSLVNKLGR